MQVATNHPQQPRSNKKRTGIEHHRTDARIDWNDRLPNHVAIYCANGDKCVTPGVKAYVNLANIDYSGWTGRCSPCVDRDGLPLRLKGRGDFPSGAYFDFDDRDPADRGRAKLYCPEGIHPRYILAEKYQEMLNKGKSGFCRACSKRQRPTEDVVLKPWNSVEHWSESTKDHVPVTCGFCGLKRSLQIRAINRRKKDGRGFTGLCQSHRVGELQSFYLSDAGPNGNRKEKRGRGRQAGEENFDRSQFLSELAEAIRDLAIKGKKERDISRKLVAKNYKLGGEFISADTLTKRLRLSSIEIPFPDYVELVLRVKP